MLFLHSISFVFWRLHSSLSYSFVHSSRFISPPFCRSHSSPPSFFCRSIDRSKPWYSAVQLTLEVLITVMRLSLFLPVSLSRSVHPSCSPFVRQRFSRSVHLSSGPEPIRCIRPSFSRSVSPTHSVVSDSSLILFSSVLSIIQ